MFEKEGIRRRRFLKKKVFVEEDVRIRSRGLKKKVFEEQGD